MKVPPTSRSSGRRSCVLRSLRLACCLSLLAVAARVGAQESAKTLDDFKKVFSEQSSAITDETRAGLKSTFASYRLRVDELRARYQEQGNLNATKDLVAELARIDEGTLTLETLDQNPIELLTTHRETLRNLLESAERQRAQKLSTLYKHYQRSLGNLKVALVQAGDLDGASKVEAELLSAQAELTKTEQLVRNLKEEGKLPQSFLRGLALWYGFDEDEKGTVTDKSENGHEGAVAGAQWVPNGISKGAYAFDGVDDQIDITKHLPDMRTLTLAVWINYEGTQGDGGIFSDYDGAGAHDLFLSLSGASNIFIVADKGEERWKAYVQAGQDLGKEWHHIVWVMAASQSSVFVDGKLVEKVSGSYSNVGYHNGHVGLSFDGTGYVRFKGRIDELMIWNRLLSDSEVKGVYDFHRQ